ncbi:XRE family transcriptional regulator [Thalassotalea fonticola]|uniref:XRE family transcriptional regulator n=1 Tax=Thalassotalea fonticola TaxID=3065649 RepID=A0ABZ0GMM8_9GAMM|nr:XRE family transcriptional regulator [Colwelliaceae bacterium S1-1]
MTKDINNTVGTQLKIARNEKGWSLDTTSVHTGVSKAMLGQIERGESSPTITRLWKIASGFHLPITYFLSTPHENNETAKVLNTEKGISITTLFPFDKTTKSEVLSLILTPSHEQMSQPHNIGVIEHILVIEGEIEYFLDQQWHPLRAGEVVKFDANQNHGYRNTSTQPAKFHNIICYTDKGKF